MSAFTEREEFITAHRLVMAAVGCLQQAYGIIETNIDAGHPSLVSLGAAADGAELAEHRLCVELARLAPAVVKLEAEGRAPA